MFNVYGHTMLNTPVLVSITEVKQHWVKLVPGWVTAWEYLVQEAILALSYYYELDECRPNFSHVQETGPVA